MQRLDPSFGAPTAAADLNRPPDRHPSAVRQAATILAEQLSVVLVVVAVGALSACLALLALDAWRGVSVVLDRMIGATRVVVFLDPQLSRIDAQSVGSQLKALPGVGAAHLRTKEEASSEVEKAGDSLRVKGILLPDAWVLSLRRPSSASSLNSLAETLQVEVGKLPGIQRVLFDKLWVTELDRLVSAYRESATDVIVVIVASSALILFGTFFIGTRALSRGRRDLPRRRERVRVFAYISLVFAIACAVFAFLLHALTDVALSAFVTHMPAAMQTGLSEIGRLTVDDALSVASAILVSALVGTWLGTRVRELPA